MKSLGYPDLTISIVHIDSASAKQSIIKVSWEIYFKMRARISLLIQAYRSSINGPTYSLKDAFVVIITLLLLLTELYTVYLIKNSKEYDLISRVYSSISISALGPQTVTVTPLASGTKFASPTGSGTVCSEATP